MIQQELDDFVILHKENISFHPQCVENIIAVMNHFSLDSSCPILPTYHRRFAIYESNIMRPFKTKGIELHEHCIVFREDVWEKILTFELRAIEQKIKELNLNHGLVCNAIIYAG